MKCPHCIVEIHAGFATEWVNRGGPIGMEEQDHTQWQTTYMACPACRKAIINLHKLNGNVLIDEMMVYPKTVTRPLAAKEVPAVLSEDFNEACLVLGDSPKASAALSRRCLQQLLEFHGYLHKDLGKAISAALASNTLPGSLARNLDAIRNIGNFAAHPTKDTNSGTIVGVEPEEADWNLDVLEGLFDFYYVQPAIDQAKIDNLNAKLLAAGKAPMKQ
jgi:hypothetical protein